MGAFKEIDIQEKEKRMKSLKDYVKKNSEKMETRVKSVNLLTSQCEYIEEKNLNLSEIVRDMLTDFIKSNNKGGRG